MQNQLPKMSLNDCAIFLDFDGTLVALESTPDAVKVSEDLKQLLLALDTSSAGAIALISGRSIDSLDALLSLPKLNVSGSHGMQFRFGEDQPLTLHPDVSKIPETLIAQCQAFCHERQLIWEEKPFSIAIHYRNHPDLEDIISEYLSNLIAPYPKLTIQQGKLIQEIKPRNIDKSSALEIFMQYPQFQGKTPWYFGDDVTDEDAFAWILNHQGIAVKVGDDQSLAPHHLKNHLDVIKFLQLALKSEE